MSQLGKKNTPLKFPQPQKALTNNANVNCYWLLIISFQMNELKFSRLLVRYEEPSNDTGFCVAASWTNEAEAFKEN